MNPRPFNYTPVFEWNYTSQKPIVINQGGTSSGKTYGILQSIICKLMQKPGMIATVVGQDIPNLKAGCIRDTREIFEEDFFKQWLESYNAQDKTFTLKNRSILENKSYDDWQDAKSGKRDYLFVNEANGVPEEIFDELHIRTKIQSFIDYNPNIEFWAHKMIRAHESGQRKDIDFFISNFTHNPHCSQSIREKILNYKRVGDLNNWRVYGLGLTGKVQGLIFPNVKAIDSFPEDAEVCYYGLDFGFSNDPTVLSRGTFKDGALILDQMLYETGLTNDDIAERFEKLLPKSATVYADSADPKSIEDLKRRGFDIRPAIKGKDSIIFGIDYLKSKELFLTVHSGQAWKEQRSYSWDQRSKDKNKPIDAFNHFWDSVRYMLSPIAVPTGGGNFGFLGEA